MAEVSYESVLEQVRRLPFNDRQKLLENLVKEVGLPEINGMRLSESVPEIDRSRESLWLKEHAQDYAGKWVVLSGDQLIGFGDDGVAIFNEAKARGVDRPILFQVEPPDTHPFGFWL